MKFKLKSYNKLLMQIVQYKSDIFEIKQLTIYIKLLTDYDKNLKSKNFIKFQEINCLLTVSDGYKEILVFRIWFNFKQKSFSNLLKLLSTYWLS